MGYDIYDVLHLVFCYYTFLFKNEDDIYIEKKALGSPESFSANIDLVLNANKKEPSQWDGSV